MASAPPVPAPATRSTGVPSAAEAAVRWRLGAARIDNVIVYGAYLVLCAVAHWRFTSPDHLLVLGVGSVAYHFVLESRDGGTPSWFSPSPRWRPWPCLRRWR